MDILDVSFVSSDLGETTVRDYLQTLLEAVMVEGESFSGKRPFGNSGWEHDIAKPFVAHGVVKGTLDDDGYIDELDSAEFEKAMLEAIARMCAA